MPIVKNRSGHERMEITNLSEIHTTTDGLEALQTITNTKIQSVDTRLDECIGHTNNTTEMGDGSNQLRSVMLGYDRSNQKVRSLLVDSGGKLECSVSDLEVTMQNVNLNTDTLEAKIQSIDTRLDNTIGAINNTTAIGDGQSVIKSISLGYDRSNGKGVSFLVDAAGHQQIDIVSMPAATGSATSANQVIIEASLTAMEAKMDVDNVVYDNQLTKLTAIDEDTGNILTKLTEIDTVLDTSKTVHDNILTKNTNNETLLTAIDEDTGNIKTATESCATDLAAIEVLITTLDGVQDNVLTKLGEIETTNNAVQSALEGTLTVGSHAVTNAGTFAVQAACSGTVTANLGATDNAVLDDIAQKLGDIETAVQILDNAISGNEMQVDVISMPSTTVSGTVTANLSATDNAVLDAIETTNNAIQAAVEGTLTVGSHAVTNAGTFAVQAACSGTVTANLSATDNAVLDAIETTNNAIQAAVEGTLTVGSHAVTNAGTFAVQAACSGTVTANLSATDNAVLDASLVKQTNIETLITTLDGVQDNVLTKITNNETLLTAIDSDTNAIKVSAAALVVDAAATEVLITATNGLLTTLDGVQDNVLTKITNNETLLTAIDSDTNAIKVSAAALVVDAAATEVLITATNGLLTTLDGVQDNVLTKITNNETLLTAIDSDTDAIKTSTAACATDLAALEVLITTLDGVQDNVLTKITNNETLLTAIDADTNAIKVSAAALVVDAAATEVLITATNGLLTTLDGVQDNVLTKITNNETLLTAIDSDTNAIKDSTASCATDLAALEVLQTATNSKIDTFDAVLDASLVKQTSMATDLAALEVLNTSILAKIQPTRDVVTIFNNTSLGADATITSGEVDMLNFRHIRIVGFSDEDDKSGQIQIWGATSSGGTYFDMGFSSASYSSSAILVPTIENIPVRYIKLVITDQTGGSSNIILYGFRLN